MRIELSERPVKPPQRGRKSMDYSIFGGNTVMRIYGDDPVKIRQKMSNIMTGAKNAGYNVRTHLLISKTGYVGCISRKILTQKGKAK